MKRAVSGVGFGSVSQRSTVRIHESIKMSRIRNTFLYTVSVNYCSNLNLTPLKWNTNNSTKNPKLLTRHLAWGADDRTRPGIPSCDGSRPPRRAGWAGCCWTHPRPPPPSPFTPLLGITINLEKDNKFQCCGSEMFIQDPDFYPSRIPNLGSQIQKQQRMRGVRKKITCHTLFNSQKL